MNQPTESIEEYEAAMLTQQAASVGHEPMLFDADDGDDDSLTLIDREH